MQSEDAGCSNFIAWRLHAALSAAKLQRNAFVHNKVEAGLLVVSYT